MASGGVSPELTESEKMLFCKVCTEKYTLQERRPKLLPCGHTYCMRCIATVNPRHCPTCRQVFELTDDDAAHLPDNLTIKELMSCFEVPVSETKDGESTCEECHRGLKTVSWCHHCRRQICKKCTKSHSTMRSFEGHIVASLDAIDLNEVKQLHYCKLHKTNKLQKYCRDCKTVICCVCKVANHQQHTVVDLDSVKDEHYIKLNKLVDDIVSIQERERLKSDRSSRKSNMLDNNYQECIDDMNSFFTNLRSNLDEAIDHKKKKLKENIDAFKLSSTKKYKKETEEADISLSRIGSTLEIIQPILDRHSPVEVSQALHHHTSSLQNLLGQSPSMTGIETESRLNLAYGFLSFTHHPICDDFASSVYNTSFQAYSIVPANTEVICNNGLVGHPYRIIIRLRDRKNEPCSHHSKHMKLEASVCLKTDSTSRFDCQVQRIRNEPGEHEASFVPPVVGTYDVVVKVMGESVPSPSIIVYRLDAKYSIANNALCTSVTMVDENNQRVSEEIGIVVECIDPTSEYIKPEKDHFADVLETTFDLQHLGEHSVRVMHYGNLVETRRVSVTHLTIKNEKSFEIFDIVVLPSDKIMFLDAPVDATSVNQCRIGICNGTVSPIILAIKYNTIPRLAVSPSIEQIGCVCLPVGPTTSMTFFTHSILQKENTVDLGERIIPEALAMTSNGNILICTSSNIKVFLSDSTLRTITIAEAQNVKPSGVCVDFKDNIFISDSESRCVYMLNSDFEVVKSFGPNSEITYPLGVAVSNSGYLLVLEKDQILIVKTEDQQLVGIIVLPYNLNGTNNKIVCTKDDYIYVSNQSFVIKMHISLSQNTADTSDIS